MIGVNLRNGQKKGGSSAPRLSHYRKKEPCGSFFRCFRLVAVMLGLVRPFLRHADVLGLLLGQLGQLGVELL